MYTFIYFEGYFGGHCFKGYCFYHAMGGYAVATAVAVPAATTGAELEGGQVGGSCAPAARTFPNKLRQDVAMSRESAGDKALSSTSGVQKGYRIILYMYYAWFD